MRANFFLPKCVKCLCCVVPEGTLSKRVNTDSASKSASMPHSQTLASMARIRCHARTPAVCYVCLPLRILCPFNHGPTPRWALRLNHSRSKQETMPRCLCDKSKSRYVRERAGVGVYACVFMFRLCYGLLTACEWDPCVAKKKGGSHFYHQGGGCRSFHERQQGKACGQHDLASCTLLSLLPADLIVLSSKERIRHAPHGSQVRGHIISDMGFLLRTYNALKHNY